jgi:hypothetical protein
MVFLSQYIYTKQNLCKIIPSREYVIYGNFTVLFIKYILLVYAFIYKIQTYNIYNEIKLLIIVYIVFNIHYINIVGKVFIPKILDSSNKTYQIDDGPAITIFKNIFDKN